MWSARRCSATAAPPRRSRSAPCTSMATRQRRNIRRAGLCGTISVRLKRAKPPPRSNPKNSLQARRRRHRLRLDDFLRSIRSRRLAVLRHLRRRSPCRRGGGPDVGCEPVPKPAEIKAALRESAVKVGESEIDPCAVGAGLVEAVGAIEDLSTPPLLTPPLCEAPASEVSAEEARAPGDWGTEFPASPAPSVSPQPPVGPVTSETQRRPRTFFRQRPSKVIRTHGQSARVVFRFGSNEAGVSYACRIDGGFFRPCPERLTRRFSVGSHVGAGGRARCGRQRRPYAGRFPLQGQARRLSVIAPRFPLRPAAPPSGRRAAGPAGPRRWRGRPGR